MSVRAALGCVLAGSLLGCGGASHAASSDLRGLASFLEDVHPAIDRYVTPDELSALVDAEAARLDALDAPDDLEVGLSIHRVLGRIGDGHLAVAIPTFQPSSTAELSFVPVMPITVGERVLVDAAVEGVPAGAELVAIDSVPIATIEDALAPLVLVDGARESVQRENLERAFARYYHLAFGMRPSYVIRMRDEDGAERDVEVAGVDREGLGALAAARQSAPLRGPVGTESTPWPFAQALEGATLLRLASFGIPDEAEYARRVDAIFAELPPDETLVIDLRGNEGGLRTHGIAVLNHVLAEPYAQWRSMRARVRRVPDAWRSSVSFPYVPEEALAGWFPSDDELVREGDPLSDRMVPSGAGHGGPIIVFVDGATNSAAIEMLAALRASRADVTIVGTETGGECGRHVGEMPVLFTTPERGFAVLASLMALEHVAVTGCEPGRGFVPDVAVTYGERDFLERRDPYLEALSR